MPMYCSPCEAVFVGATRCPRCASELIPVEDAPVDGPPEVARPELPGRPSMGNRFVVGSLVALGLYLGLRRLTAGALLPLVGNLTPWWDTPAGLTLMFGLQCVAVAWGGLMAGAARTSGFGTGLLVGGVCGGLFLAAEVLDGTPPQLLTLYIQPILLGLLGGITAGVGARLWPAVPDIDTPTPASKTLSSVRLLLGGETPRQTERPTSWVKVIAAVLLMASGILMADEGRMALQRGTAGMFKVESVGQGRFVSFQLATLAVLIGGMTAAAGTGAGMRHGFLAALFASALVIGAISSKAGELPTPVSYTLDLLAVPPEPFSLAAIAVASTLILFGAAGGWLGGQLFLPLAPPHMRQRLRTVD